MAAEQYPADWDDRRRRVYQRDNYECQQCGAQGGRAGNTELHAHHVTPISEGGSHALNNLVTLCKNCHNNQHAHDITGGRQSTEADATTGWVWKWLRIILLPGIYIFSSMWFLAMVTDAGVVVAAGGHLLVIGVGILLGWSLPRKVLYGYGIYAAGWAVWAVRNEATPRHLIAEFIAGISDSALIAIAVFGYILFLITLPCITALALKYAIDEHISELRASLTETADKYS